MDLFGTLCLLYLLQCTVWLPGGASVFVGTLFGWVIGTGPGLRILHPLPAGRTHLGSRFPLVERGGSLVGRGAATWRAASSGAGEPVDLAALRGAVARESVVRVSGRPFARGADPTHAERIAALLRAMGEAAPDARKELVERAFAESLSLSGFEAARARFSAGTRVLAWTSDAYWLALFLVLPAAALSMGIENSLRILVAALLALHLVTLLCFARSHGRLFPARRDERVQAVFGAALYPPSVLRAYHQLRASALGSFHPAAVAVAVLPREQGRAFVRAEIARASARSGEATCPELGFSLAELEARALRRLIVELGETPETLLAAPPRVDPLARSYCPACLCEYRRDDGVCTDCAIALERHPGRIASSETQSR